MKYLLCLLFALATLLVNAQTPKATSLIEGANFNSTQDFDALMKADGYVFVAETNPEALVLYAYNYWPVVGNDTLVAGLNRVQHLVSLGNVMHVETVFITYDEALYTKVLKEFTDLGFTVAPGQNYATTQTTHYVSANHTGFFVDVMVEDMRGAANNMVKVYTFTVGKE